jgi:hypothetical protein
MRLISAVSGVQFPAPPFICFLTYLYALQHLYSLKTSCEKKEGHREIEKEIKDRLMENYRIEIRQQSGRDKDLDVDKGKCAVLATILMLFLSFVLLIPELSCGAETKTKKPSAQKEAMQKETIITDSNVQASFKKGEELLKKGDIEGSQRILAKVYDYTKEALTTINFIQSKYEKLVNDPSTDQSEKEDIFIKLQRVKQVRTKYTSIKTASAYDLGYIYTKKRDPEKARQFLAEVLETTPFSTKKGSMWMKAKTLLLELYDLEGEF